MKIIGITGGAGAGKSTVLHYIQKNYPGVTLQADVIGHFLMQPGQSCYRPVVELFGGQILRTDGSIDRKKVAEKVFLDARQLKKLNAIVHPRVKTHILQRMEEERQKDVPFFFLEAALLLEEKYDAFCDEVWYIDADEAVRRRRLMEDRGYTQERVDGVFISQLTGEEFRKRCTCRIENNGDVERTYRQIRERMRSL